MTHPLLALVVTLGACALSACGGNGSELPRQPELASAPAGTGTLVVTVTGFESDAGQALINLFVGPEGFPGDPELALRALARPIVDGRVELLFEDVPAGPFAISAFHDEDSDRELDKGMFGIPSESWGVSRDAGGFMGPPSYDSAVLELKPGERLAVEFPVG